MTDTTQNVVMEGCYFSVNKALVMFQDAIFDEGNFNSWDELDQLEDLLMIFLRTVRNLQSFEKDYDEGDLNE